MICGYAWIIQSIPPNLKYGSSLPWLCFSDAFMVQPIAGWTQNDKTKMAQKGDQWIEMVTEMAHPLGAECCLGNSHRSSMPQLVAFFWLFSRAATSEMGKKTPIPALDIHRWCYSLVDSVLNKKLHGGVLSHGGTPIYRWMVYETWKILLKLGWETGGTPISGNLHIIYDSVQVCPGRSSTRGS